MSKDYYKILGVTEFDSADTIKKAYRNLARKFHPDIAGDSEIAILRFKEINEAYEILSNQVKKEEYDRVRRFYSYAQGTKTRETHSYSKQQTNPSDTENKKQKYEPFSWEEILFGRRGKSAYEKSTERKPVKGKDIFTEVQISVLEAITGTDKVINMLQTDVCPKCGGRKFVNGTICRHCNGSGEHSEHKKFTVKIPAGIKNKSKIRLAGEGEKGKDGGCNGDLYITVVINNTQEYKTDGLNIVKTVSLSPDEAVLGTEVQISSISGNYRVKIMPNTQSGQKIRLSGCGIVQNEKVGDMIITVEINLPKNMTEEEIQLYKKLAEIRKGKLGNSIYDR